VRTILTAFLVIAGLGMADTIALRDGRTVNGSYLGGDTRTVRVAVGDRIETYRVEEISTISFTAPAPAPPVAAEQSDDRRLREAREERREERRVAQELAAGTNLTIRMIDSIDSERDKMGQSFRASLDEPVMDSNGSTVIPRGADVVVKLVDDEQSGKLAGRTILTLDLVSLQVNGQTIDIDTKNVTEQSGSRTARSAKVIGGTAIAGAIIGAIAGGGKGAAIGTAAGAGAGTVAEVATKGQRVRIPSETRLTFTLDQPVRW